MKMIEIIFIGFRYESSFKDYLFFNIKNLEGYYLFFYIEIVPHLLYS
jgi:hypothetical protein